MSHESALVWIEDYKSENENNREEVNFAARSSSLLDTSTQGRYEYNTSESPIKLLAVKLHCG